MKKKLPSIFINFLIFTPTLEQLKLIKVLIKGDLIFFPSRPSFVFTLHFNIIELRWTEEANGRAEGAG